MFSIAAINDKESQTQWEPLAPTKEAQEFRITQSYHEGLLKLHAKDYENARELLESVLKDPLVANTQVDSHASDGHLLQLRFLALKNLATVFLQQGPCHFERALHCYLQAVEIDAKDSVVWNQLGTLACSLGFLSISRWAFEQGLVCSPNNWNCMEKLLEVLVAIGDEATCLSVAELILRYWPSHSRAYHVKKTIEESVPIPFSPRGIDKLEPIHARLKFSGKRKAPQKFTDEGPVSKKLNPSAELHLAEVSWGSLVDALLGILSTLSVSDSEQSTETSCRSGNTRLAICLPPHFDQVIGSAENKGIMITKAEKSMLFGDCRSEKASIREECEASNSEEQPQERRSTRLERLRNQRPGKDEMQFTDNKDRAKVVIECLLPFIASGPDTKDSDDGCYFSQCHDVLFNSSDNESTDVEIFVAGASKNYGPYHLGHLLLEAVASRSPPHNDYLVKFLELDKYTRHWGQSRTPECSLFLAELYYDFGSCSLDFPTVPEFMSEASYHLCKIIETVALEYPFHLDGIPADGNYLLNESVHESLLDKPLFNNKRSFWVRFYWLSGRLSSLDGNRAKAHEEFCISLLLLSKKNNANEPRSSVQRQYCKVIQQLTTDRILHDINLLEIDFLLKGPVIEMVEKGMYLECIKSLAPLLFSSKDVHVDFLPVAEKEGLVSSVELSALDVMLKACEKAKPMDVEVSLNCHHLRLQILMLAAGMEVCIASHKPSKISGLNAPLTSDSDPQGSARMQYNYLIAEEVRAISQFASQMKDSNDPCTNNNGLSFPIRSIDEIQSLLVTVMYNITNKFLCKKSSGFAVLGQTERRCFINAAIGFCKLQHLNPTIPVKSQVELIVAVHDLLAEFGVCCAGEDGEGEEGTFLKLAIKHLLALDTKLKPNFHHHDRELSINQFEEQLQDSIHGGDTSKNISSHGNDENNDLMAECRNCSVDASDDRCHVGEKGSNRCIKYNNELTEDEREELELGIDSALDQCFFCLYGLNLRSDPSHEDDLATHKNTSRGDYQTKEQCADVFQYILPYAMASSKNGLIKLRRVLRAIWKHFPQPAEGVLAENAIDRFLDDPDLCENELSEAVGSDGLLDRILKTVLPHAGNLKQCGTLSIGSSKPYFEVYCNLYYLLAQSEEMNATDKYPGFVLTKEGEEFVAQNAKLFKYDLHCNPLRFESWKRLANIYDEEVDLLLNDGSKHINVAAWNKNATLPQRVEMGRRRSRRCLLMSLALAKTSIQQCEMHELLALVYYDSLQNVVPLYDQRSVQPSKDATWMMLCRNSLKHFEEAFARRQDWSHAFYLGKLSEKLGCSHGTSFSYYDKAITLNPSAVDAVYRMHASRLKLLCTCGKQDVDAMKVVAAYSFSQSTKETVMNILEGQADMGVENAQAKDENQLPLESYELEEAWNLLYDDGLSGLQTCIEGDLKHFHKARYMLAQGLYRRGEDGYLQRAKDELSFCFKSSRSSFTINMWEIDSMFKKGRRKSQGFSCNRKALEINLPESSRKFITCIRKYMLFYLKLLEGTGDICTLERAYTFLRTDKRFSLCLEDLVPVALGRCMRALILSMNQTSTVRFDAASSSLEHIQEKIFTLFVEQGNLWPDICNLPEFSGSELSESSLDGYLYGYIQWLEENLRLETLEGLIEKIRKRFKNPKLSNSNYSKVCRYASIVWCRTILVSLALITPSHHEQVLNGPENSQLLHIDFETSELWSSSAHQKNLEGKWGPVLSKLKNVVLKKTAEENTETANILLRCCYSLYRESWCGGLSFGVNLYLAPLSGTEGVETLDLSIPRKLLVWAYMLLHGQCASVATIIKYCEENVKSKIKKGHSMPLTPTQATIGKHTGGDVEASPGESRKDLFMGPLLQQCTNPAANGV